MPLCDACAALRLDDLRSRAGYRLHANAKDIVTSARSCDLCALIQAALLQDLSSDEAGARLKDALPAEPVILYGGFLQDEEGDEAEEEEEVGGTDDGTSSAASLSSSARLTGIEVHVGLDDNLNIVSLNLFTVPEPDRSADEVDEDGDISGRPLLDDAGSEEALALLRTWLGVCVREHPQCRRTFAGLEALEDDADDAPPPPPPPLPTRVIDVGGAVPRLFVSNGARAKYAALSHCCKQNLVLLITPFQHEFSCWPLFSSFRPMDAAKACSTNVCSRVVLTLGDGRGPRALPDDDDGQPRRALRRHPPCGPDEDFSRCYGCHARPWPAVLVD